MASGPRRNAVVLVIRKIIIKEEERLVIFNLNSDVFIYSIYINKIGI